MPAGRTPAHLGPHVVGVRVVVRRVLPGETGPSGGPALTDVLGTCEAWEVSPDGDHARVVVRREDGTAVEIDSRDIVSGKPVPPRPSRHRRLPAADADRRAARGWPPHEVRPLVEDLPDGWLLRAAEGFSSRANSVLALGDPGVGSEEAVRAVEEWYAGRVLVPRAHVLGGEDAEPLVREAFAEAGWAAYEHTLLMLAPVPRVLRGVGRRPGSSSPALEVRHSPRIDAGWWATDERAERYAAAARRVLETGAAPGEPVDLVTLHDAEGRVVARGRGALDDDWVGISCLWTAPELRGQGLGTRVLVELLERAAEQGATTAYLQVVTSNERARAAYSSRGFETHHRYDYLAAPGDD